MQEFLRALKVNYPAFWQDTHVISHIRQQTLRFLLAAYCVMGVLLAGLHLVQHKYFLLARVLVFTALSVTGYLMLRRGVPFKKVGHFSLTCLCLIVLSTAVLYQHGHYLVTFQFIFVILSSGFYILGPRWGLFYSLLSVFLVGSVALLDQYFKVEISIQAYAVDTYAVAFALLFNYLMLIYIHFFFFKESQLANEKETTLLSELKTAAAQARDLAEYKTNFLITMSHEIRTPLHAIIGGLDLLSFDNAKGEHAKNLDNVKFSADILNSIINDILNLNDIEDNQIKLSKEEFQPAVVITDICQKLQAAASHKGLLLTLNVSPELKTFWVMGDPVRLGQIVMNLISNAIKYTDHGSVDVDIKARQIGDDRVQIFFNVSDTGIGIPQEVFPYIFEPFKLVNSGMKKQYHGTGLGLSLAQQLVNLHGGKLDFTSKEGIGTSFFFDFAYPLSQKSFSSGPVVPQNELGPLDIHVLIAEDNNMNAIILTTFLKKWHVNFDIVDNGLAAVETMLANRYQVILMDINMPVMDGIQASQQIRAFEDLEKAGVHIIALTATSRESLESSGALALFDDWISKPFHPQILHAKLANISMLTRSQ
ncbi:ATP-binding protein [Dyadobacter psychrophilus]|uniref:histidine kinase n=1 Tax=Dyadobacter psychrophilus TaxID=651661 RepID=A0A1T5DBK4_9BACT|nr:ATP-binding protein [Dyadobacter psychrophilus]SKB69168.1 Signal transduction histidine kinase [Dyadobacter psychrophilus]